MIVLIVISIGFPKSRRTITTSRSTWWHWSKSLWKCIELFVKINKRWLFQDYSNGLSFSLRTTKSLNRRSHSESSRGGNRESTSSNNLTALLAFPNTNAGSLDGILTAESTSITTNHSSLYQHTCCVGKFQSSLQSYEEKNHNVFRTYRKYQPS